MMLFVVDFMTMMTMALVIYPNGFKICLKKSLSLSVAKEDVSKSGSCQYLELLGDSSPRLTLEVRGVLQIL